MEGLEVEGCVVLLRDACVLCEVKSRGFSREGAWGS